MLPGRGFQQVRAIGYIRSATQKQVRGLNPRSIMHCISRLQNAPWKVRGPRRPGHHLSGLGSESRATARVPGSRPSPLRIRASGRLLLVCPLRALRLCRAPRGLAGSHRLPQNPNECPLPLSALTETTTVTIVNGLCVLVTQK